MKILVTGGAGFIGSNFVKRQISQNSLNIRHVTVLDKLTYAGNLNNFTKSELSQFEMVVGDICDASIVEKLVKNSDIVVNFAAESHVDRSITSASDFVVTNTLGTQILLENSLRYGVQKFVQISTDEVYGSIDDGSWDEEYPLLPNSPYSASKAGADLLVRSYNKTFGLNTNITRCSNNYGAFQYPEKVIPLFVTNLLLGREIPIYGSGENVRDWLHVNDHCRGIEMVIKSGQPGEIYNIGGGTELNNLELAQKILMIMGEDISKIKFVPDRQGHDKRYSVSIKKISNEMGYLPEVNFADGLRATIEFYQDNPEWWTPLTANKMKSS
jgi:dTDP-glucose 4,6-dehydratase